MVVDEVSASFTIHIEGSALSVPILRTEPLRAPLSTSILDPVPSSVIEIAPPDPPKWVSHISYPVPKDSIETTQEEESESLTRSIKVPDPSDRIVNTEAVESIAVEWMITEGFVVSLY
jgi:hypothetical protein